MKNFKTSYGFTLIEILIAILILSIMAVLMTRSLHVVMVSKERIDAANAKLEETQLAMAIINQDLQQFVNRPVVDNDGNPVDAFAVKKETGDISFTRGGYVNPEGLNQRSTLQRISYQITEQELARVTWPVLDRVASTPSYRHVLVKNVNSLQWKFLANDQKLYTEWPRPDQKIPTAIEINLTLGDGKKIKELIMLNITSTPAAKDGTSDVAPLPNGH